MFQTVRNQRTKKSKFNLSKGSKLTMKAGKLVPIYCREVLPSDDFQIQTEHLVRMQPALAPIMHNVDVSVHSFFIPTRLVWDEFEDFMTGGRDGLASPNHPKFHVTASDASSNLDKFGLSTLWDYMGLPAYPTNTSPTGGQTAKVSLLPFRCYQLLHNEWFRDQNLEEEIEFSTGSNDITDMSSAEATALLTLRNRAWGKDYFTSALPWTQRGAEAIVPLGEVEPVYKDVSRVLSGGANQPLPLGGSTEPLQVNPSSVGDLTVGNGLSSTTARIENMENMDVDPTTINALRKATALQRFLEASARFGSRYAEWLKGMFNVHPEDSRLQRPEYLGGGRKPLMIQEVLSNFQQTGSAPQGNMSGHGLSAGTTARVRRKFKEHGYIISVMSILPKPAYQQGIPKMWNRFDRYQYFIPQFAHLGEQEIKNKELYHNWSNGLDTTDPEGTFGYQERYAEYKSANDSVHGDFRENLKYWHMGRIFPQTPSLNADFIKADPTTRIFAVTNPNVDTYLVQVYNKVSALRPMPYHSIPHI